MQSEKSQERNSEIVCFFYLIFGSRIHAGLKTEDARKEAYDAVQLRYNISQGRLLNIISQQRGMPSARKESFLANARNLIGDLSAVNAELLAAQRRNERLIALLEETVNAAKI